MTIDSIYRDYFQKSKIFIYPLLEIKRGAVAVPDQTYLAYGDMIRPEHKIFLCCYLDRQDDAYLNFEREMLFGHTRFKGFFKMADGSKLFMFDFSDIGSDWDHLVHGRYSKVSLERRRKILNHFEKGTGNHIYIESFLFPEKYREQYAEILDVDMRVLERVGELCDKPDLSREKFKI
jgi:hypothetical protein